MKTRLAAALGDDHACALHRAFVLDLADRLASLPYDVTWAYTPAEAPFPALLPHARCVPQIGDDLGARMAHAVAAAFAEDTRPVLVIGADVPHVPAACLAEAAEMAATGVVLGPAEDGVDRRLRLSAVEDLNCKFRFRKRRLHAFRHSRLHQRRIGHHEGPREFPP